MKQTKPPQSQRGFTRADLYVVLMAIAMLAFIALPALGKMKPQSERLSCANNLRQLGLALAMYSANNDGFFPPRIYKPCWTGRLSNGIANAKILVCPSDGPNPPPTNGATDSDPSRWPLDAAPRSYLINSWMDYVAVYHPTNLSYYRLGISPMPIPASAVKYPSATIAFGEKDNYSGHFYMNSDLWYDVVPLDQNRHDQAGDKSSKTGGSNYAFVDGNVRFLKYWASLAPVSLWAVTDLWRTNTISMP